MTFHAGEDVVYKYGRSYIQTVKVFLNYNTKIAVLV